MASSTGDRPPSGARNPHAGSTDRQRLAIALGLILGFMAVEVVVSVLSGSLALLSDAGHMLTDAGAIAGSMWAMSVARRPANLVWSYGLKRAEILSAAANGVSLLVVGALVGVEAVRRLLHPSPVHGVPMLSVALLGIVVNVAASLVLGRADRQSLNVEGSFKHVVTDLYAFVATAVAAVVIITTGWWRADPVASLVVVVLVLRASWTLLRPSGHILLEGTPEAVDLAEVRRHLEELPEVVAVHDLHAWALSSELPALSAHVVVTDIGLADGGAGRILDSLQHCLVSHFDVEHSTFQLEPASHSGHEPGMHE